MSKFGYEFDIFSPPPEQAGATDEQPETKEQQKQPWEMVGGIQFNKQPYIVRDADDLLGVGGTGIFQIGITIDPSDVGSETLQNVYAVFVKRNSDGGIRTVMICFDRILDYPEAKLTEQQAKLLAGFIQKKPQGKK